MIMHYDVLLQIIKFRTKNFIQMPTDIVVRKGLSLKLKGEAVLETEDLKNSSDYSIYPSDFHGIYMDI